MTDRKRTPEEQRDDLSRDEIALQVQERLGRPLSLSECRTIWNMATERAGREDFLSGFTKVIAEG